MEPKTEDPALLPKRELVFPGDGDPNADALAVLAPKTELTGENPELEEFAWKGKEPKDPFGDFANTLSDAAPVPVVLLIPFVLTCFKEV